MVKNKIRIYKIGDATGRLVYEPHGRRTHGYGHRGYEFGYTLFVYKEGYEGYAFAVSLSPYVYIAFVKAIVRAVSETALPDKPVRGYYREWCYWLKDKTWKRPDDRTEYSILASLERR